MKNNEQVIPISVTRFAEELGVAKGTVSKRLKKLDIRDGEGSGISRTIEGGYALTPQAMNNVRGYEKDYLATQLSLPDGYERVNLQEYAGQLGTSVTSIYRRICKIREQKQDGFATVNTSHGRMLVATQEAAAAVRAKLIKQDAVVVKREEQGDVKKDDDSRLTEVRRALRYYVDKDGFVSFEPRSAPERSSFTVSGEK